MERVPDTVRLRRGLRESLKVALRARDGIAVAAFRSAISAIDNAEAVDRSQAPAPIIGKVRLGVGAGEGPRRELSAKEFIDVVRTEIGDRIAAAAEYESLGRPEHATRLRAEATVLQSFLEIALEDP
jgi:uncharacterized protein YqeY